MYKRAILGGSFVGHIENGIYSVKEIRKTTDWKGDEKPVYVLDDNHNSEIRPDDRYGDRYRVLIADVMDSFCDEEGRYFEEEAIIMYIEYIPVTFKNGVPTKFKVKHIPIRIEEQ